MLADLPWQGRQVRIQLEVRRFFCVTADCPKTTFAERLPQIAAVYARSATRLHEALCLIGSARGGQAGARLATPLGMPTSPDTLLRRVKASHRSLPVSVRVLGVDDWAWKKGQRYGTILFDLERRRVIDLLPVRSTVSFCSWLKSHPEVEIISRDRGEEYTKGAALGAPQSVQVADRFHLLVNVREALTRVVDRHHTHVSEAAKAVATRRESQDSTPPIEAAGSAAPPPSSQRLSRASPQSLQRRARRLEHYHRVLELHQQGVPLRAIARREGMCRGTVRHWIRAGAFPEQAQRRRRSRADEYLEYLKRRWDEGCRNARQLTDELRELGYGGSFHTVRRRVGRWRAGDPPRASSAPRESSSPIFAKA
jgi:transposase